MENQTAKKAATKKRVMRALDDMPTMYALPLGKIVALAICAAVFGLIKLLFGR